jgi:hypothetical protein
MPLSRSLKQRARTSVGKSATAPGGQAREGNGVDRLDGRAHKPSAPKDSPVEPLDTKARVIRTND